MEVPFFMFFLPDIWKQLTDTFSVPLCLTESLNACVMWHIYTDVFHRILQKWFSLVFAKVYSASWGRTSYQPKKLRLQQAWTHTPVVPELLKMTGALRFHRTQGYTAEKTQSEIRPRLPAGNKKANKMPLIGEVARFAYKMSHFAPEQTSYLWGTLLKIPVILEQLWLVTKCGKIAERLKGITKTISGSSDRETKHPSWFNHKDRFIVCPRLTLNQCTH